LTHTPITYIQAHNIKFLDHVFGLVVSIP